MTNALATPGHSPVWCCLLASLQRPGRHPGRRRRPSPAEARFPLVFWPCSPLTPPYARSSFASSTRTMDKNKKWMTFGGVPAPTRRRLDLERHPSARTTRASPPPRPSRARTDVTRRHVSTPHSSTPRPIRSNPNPRPHARVSSRARRRGSRATHPRVSVAHLARVVRVVVRARSSARETVDDFDFKPTVGTTIRARRARGRVDGGRRRWCSRRHRTREERARVVRRPRVRRAR